MQVSSAVTPRELALALAGLWRRMASGGDNAAFALIADLGVSLTAVKTLYLLGDCPEPISLGELAERLGVSLPATSRTVDGLLHRGWLERREDEHDRRMKRVSLTPDGASTARRIADARMQGLEAFAASLSDEQRARLGEALETI